MVSKSIMSPFIVCIDGLIGAGKSTLMERLSKDYKCFPEPVKEWSLLPFLYTDLATYGPIFQFQVLISQFIQKQSFPDDDSLILVERCPWTSRNIFAPLVLDYNVLSTYDKFYKSLSYEVNLFIYLDVDPETAFQRIRNRSFVDNLISSYYLRRLYDSYKRNLLVGKSNVVVVNESSPDQVEKSVRAILTKTAASVFPKS